MPVNQIDNDEIKRKLRKLKKHEIKIRFNSDKVDGRTYAKSLVWDEFFDLREKNTREVKYPINKISAMNKDEYRSVVDEFFFHLYYRFYKENGLTNILMYDPDILSQLDLPLHSDDVAIKKKFHELTMKYHPDTGGDAAKFIELIENYRKLIVKGR